MEQEDHPRSPPVTRLVAAPMVDQSELAFRMLCREYGAGLCFTPMFHAALFVKDQKYRLDNFSSCQGDRPLIVQFCANDPEIFAAAAKLVEDKCDGVDLNLGCPQGIARKGHYGSFLQDEWDLIHSMILAASKVCRVPISCKIRVFPQVCKTIEYAKRLRDAGAGLLTVHGRTREMKGQQTGLADWSQIRAVKESIKDIPILSNGNIQFIQDIDRCLEETSCDGVMSAEGLLYSPSLFSGRHIPVWILCMKYIDYFKMYGQGNLGHLKAHLFKMLHHVVQEPENHSMRDQLTNARCLEQYESLVNEIREKYEIPGEDQSLEMTTLPVPLYVSQPYFRFDRLHSLEERQGREDRISQQQEASQGKSKRQIRKELKKQRRQSLKKHQHDLCLTCKTNPRGISCTFSLCKICCQIKGESCENHSLNQKTRKKRQKQIENKE